MHSVKKSNVKNQSWKEIKFFLNAWYSVFYKQNSYICPDLDPKNKKMKFLTILWAWLYVGLTYAQIPTYYESVNLTATGANLQQELSTLITQTQTNFLSYTQIWSILQNSDLDPSDPANNRVLMVYGFNDNDGIFLTDRTRSRDSLCNISGSCIGRWNREHVFPQSLANPPMTTSSAGMGTDAHNLRASDVQMNSSRGNKPFAAGTGNAQAVGPNNAHFYPGDEWRGDVARVILYMYLRYPNGCVPTVVSMGSTSFSADIPDILLQWNAEDPPSPYEIQRNNVIFQAQGNRNPFIDNPFIATLIWGGPTASNFWNLEGSDIIPDPFFETPQWIAFENYLENENLTPTNSIQIGQFRIRDGGLNADSDNLPTLVNRLRFRISGNAQLNRLAFYVDDIEVAEIPVLNSEFNIENLPIHIPDTEEKTLKIFGSFLPTQTDVTQFQIQIIEAETSQNSTPFTFTNAGGASTEISENKNRIKVQPKKLVWQIQPSSLETEVAMSPAPSIRVEDHLGNKALNNNISISLTGNVPFSNTSVHTVTTQDGVATFNQISFANSFVDAFLIASAEDVESTVSSNLFSISETLIAWEVNGLTGYGPSPLTPNRINPLFSSSGLVRAPGITTSGTAAGSAWGGTAVVTENMNAALNLNSWVSFSIVVPEGYTTDFIQIKPYTIRRSSTGSSHGQWQYRINQGNWENIGSAIVWGANTTATGNLQSAIPLHQISALNQIASQTTVEFRIVLWGSTSTSGTWYINNTNGFDLSLMAFVKEDSSPNDFFRSKQSGDWENSDTWQSSREGLLWYDATSYPQNNTQNIRIRQHHHINITANQHIHSLNIAPRGLLRLKGNSILTIADGGALTFESSPFGNGTLGVCDQNTSILGNVIFENYIPARRAFRFISSAVFGQTIQSGWQEGVNNETPSQNQDPNPGYGIHITGMGGHTNGFDASQTNNPSAYVFNTFTQTWDALDNTLHTFTPTTAYRILVRGNRMLPPTSNNVPPSPTVLRSRGTVWVGQDLEIPFSVDPNNNQTGFVLVGNPFASTVDFLQVAQNSTGIKSDVLYVWDTQLNTRGGYCTVLPSGISTIGNGNKNVRPGQAVFFEIQNETHNGVIRFKEIDKVENTFPMSTFSQENLEEMIRVFIQNQGAISLDGAIILGNDYQNNRNFPKFSMPDESISWKGNNDELYSIIPFSSISSEYILDIKNYRSTQYKLRIEVPQNGMTYYLNDALTNQSYTIENGVMVYPYTINENDASSAPNRFKINVGEPLGIESHATNAFLIWPNPVVSNEIFIQGIAQKIPNEKCAIYSILGQKIAEFPLHFEQTGAKIILPNEWANGIYVLEIYQQKKKIIINR